MLPPLISVLGFTEGVIRKIILIMEVVVVVVGKSMASYITVLRYQSIKP